MNKKLLSLALAVAVFGNGVAFAEDKKDDKKKEDKKPKTLAEMIKDREASSGLFDVYQDKKTGEHLMVIEESQLDTPFLYFAHTVEGLLDAGHFRGGYRETKLIEFRRHFERIDIITKTPRYKFDQDSAIAKASDANISEAVLASLKIEKDEEGKIAVNIDKLFKSEALHKVSPWARVDDKNAKKRFKVGKLDDKKSRIVSKRNYDNNMDVVVDYVFTNSNPSVWGSAAVTDPRAVSVKVQHSFVALPKNNFKPRKDDARIGYFHQQFDRMTASNWTGYDDAINRWHLAKKDPNAAVSEPVKPITWWIENTTPLEWRETIKEGVLAWNSSFEKAGFKNAIEVKVQPDDAKWDAGDINYNVLRWTSSPNPPFGGYGPSLANPLTGELIGADIMLEYIFMKNRWIYDNLFSEGHASLTEHELPQGQMYCSQGQMLHMDLAVGRNLAIDDPIKQNEILDQALRELILHEVGHTLGLNHNMKASTLWNAKDVHDASKTQGILTGSVMDYSPINLAPLGVKQGDYFQVKPGPYDDWAIEYGYSTALSDDKAEEKRLAKILSRSAEHGLAFGNDADDMRAPGRHIDPRVMTNDLSSDPVAYAVDRLNLVNDTFGQLKGKLLKEGDSHHALLVGANFLYGHYRGQANVISRQIGGVYVERHAVGSNEQPYTPVPYNKQKAAMSALTTYVFAPDTLSNLQPLLNSMQHQRRGFNHYGKNEDPKAHAMILNMQKGVLAQLLHKNVLTRISDTSLYGNEYSLSEMMTDLTKAIFVKAKSTNSISRNLQVAYVEQLIGIAGIGKKSSYDNLAKAQATYQLQSILSKDLSRRASQDEKAHKAYIDLLINKAFEA